MFPYVSSVLGILALLDKNISVLSHLVSSILIASFCLPSVQSLLLSVKVDHIYILFCNGVSVLYVLLIGNF